MSDEPSYLLALYLEEQGRSPPIAPGRIADRLDRSPPAVTEMCQRMADRGLLTYEPYEGATLTPEGRSRAADYYERYVVLVEFFDDVLELDDPEAEARQFVGVLSKDVTDRLAETLLGADASELTQVDAPSVTSESR
jgi:DtxR family Mn-dependent transcriptional regulator